LANNHNLIPFKSGADWKGNRYGRPKKKFLRDDITNTLFLNHKEDISKVVEQVFDNAKAGDPWAMKLVFEYFLTKPKVPDEPQEDDTHAHLVDEFSKMPSELLVNIRDLILEDMKTKGEPQSL
jgi:hypothetical protein